VVDSLAQCREIGELHHALAERALTDAGAPIELADIVAGTEPGRTAPDEIVIFDSTGTALQDVAAAIVVYDFSHKRNPVAPIVMGFCRALVYAVAASVDGTLVAAAVAGGGVMWVYVSGLTVVARLAGPKARWLVPLLIAGISLVDAVFIVVIAPGMWPLAIVAALGFPLTLFLQRWVPGD